MTMKVEAQATSWLNTCVPERQITALRTWLRNLASASEPVGIVTSAVRALEGDTILTNRLRNNATALGMDWSHSWSNRVYRWRGTLMASDVRGTRQAMTLTQRSATHYRLGQIASKRGRYAAAALNWTAAVRIDGHKEAKAQLAALEQRRRSGEITW